MIAAEHHEHAASVEGYGIEGDGDSMSYVPTTQFQYPEDGEPEKPVVRDQWRSEPIYRKCQRRFAPVKSGDVMTMPMLDKRLDVLQLALREAVEQMDVGVICRLADKLRGTSERLEAEKIAESSPGTRELHGDIVIHDDAGRSKVVIQFSKPVDQGTRRWVQTHAGGTMGSKMIGVGDPSRERVVEFGEAVDGSAFQAQGRFKVSLDGADEAFDFSLAPGVVGLGVEQTDAEIGTDDFGVRVNKGLALVGVEFERQATAQNGLLEAVQKGGGIARQVVGSERNQPAVVVEDDAKLTSKRRNARRSLLLGVSFFMRRES